MERKIPFGVETGRNMLNGCLSFFTLPAFSFFAYPDLARVEDPGIFRNGCGTGGFDICLGVFASFHGGRTDMGPTPLARLTSSAASVGKKGAVSFLLFFFVFLLFRFMRNANFGPWGRELSRFEDGGNSGGNITGLGEKDGNLV
ncbi:hypothetical protein IMZ48_11600 [Candidatus Bathyarchaeota archaeon]|nr:hypothetical protein [Candidatus Bathyarchaeota archaeon]